ncbi:MAG: pilus assembly protein PilM [Planctomycetota bacterium]|nr:pilus assembly protein PilM [Planctomycetota bacterium]
MLGTRTLLGLAVDEVGVMVAEIGGRAGRPQVRRVGHWAFPAPFEAGQVQELGRLLKQFLRANHFSSKHAIVGIPTKWIVTKEIVAPPATPDALAGMLSIQAERAFSLNASELIFDYCGKTSTSEKSEVLLVATQRQVVNQVKELTDAAGLQVRSITVSTLAFGKHLSEGGPQQRYGLYTRPTYCEFWSQCNGRLRSIQHVPMASASGATERTELLASTIQRLILLSSEQNQSPPHEITVYDASNLPDGVMDRLHKQLAPQITISNGNAGVLSDGLGSTDGAENSQSIAAASLAITALSAGKLSVDFLNSHIGCKKTSGRGRLTTWVALAAVVLIVGVGAVIADWHGKRTDIAAYSERLELISEDVTAAREMVDRISYAGSWTLRKPQFLECVRQLTLAFPESPSVWATSLALSEQAEGSLVGKAVDDASFSEVLDKMKQNSEFSGVMVMHLRDAGGSSTEKEFAVTFKFRGLK